MTQYVEREARLLEHEGNLASARGDHEMANQLWAMAAEFGTVEESDDDDD